MSWRDPQDELDLAELYARTRIAGGRAEPEAVMVGMLWAASRLATYLGRRDLHDEALATLKAQEADELAAHRGRIGPGSGVAQ